MMTQKVLRNRAIRASRRDRIGTSGLSLSVLPIRCPVARAQIFSRLFNLDTRYLLDDQLA